MLAPPAAAQAPKLGNPALPAKPRTLAERLTSPRDTSRTAADKLRSPRETLKTLYYAVTLYDLFPEMMEDAIDCLDLDANHADARHNLEVIRLWV